MNELALTVTAARDPAALALVADGVSLTYGELSERVARTAHALAARGLLPAEARPLAAALRPNLPGLLLLHAAIAHGLPLLVLDPRLPAEERERLAARADCRALLLADELVAGGASLTLPLPPALDDAAPLALVPTSGSTGSAKLVVLSRGAFRASAAASATNLPLGPSDLWLLCLPLAHVGGLSIVVRCLLAGSAVVAFEPGPRGLLAESAALARCIEEHRVTLISLVPTVLEALLELQPAWSPPASLRAVLVGGAALPVPLLQRALDRGVPVLATYGSTETCSQVATTPLGTFPRTDGSLVSAGRALPGFELRFGPDERLAIRGPALFNGYLGEPPPLDADGFFHTEDRARLDESGELFVLGRCGDRIITGGENIDPRRIEAALLLLRGVRAAFVFGVPDSRFGELVAAAVVADSSFRADACGAELRQRLAPHERPRRLAVLDAFPSLANGKLDRQALRAQALVALMPWPSHQ